MALYAYPMSSTMVLPPQQHPYQFQIQPSQPSQQFFQSTPRPYTHVEQTQTPVSMVKQEDSDQQQQQQEQPATPTPSTQSQAQPQYYPASSALTFQQNPYAYGFPAATAMTPQTPMSYDIASAVHHPYMGFVPPPPPAHAGIHGGISMAAAAQFPSMVNQIITTPDSLGQKPPPGIKPRVTTTMWEDEGTLCFQVEAKGFCVARREDNNMINGTKLLNVAGMTRGRRDGILKSEKIRHVVKIGTMYLKGVWIPYERALEFSQREQIVDILYPLFVADIRSFLYHPVNYTRTIQVLAAAERKKQADHYRLQQAAAAQQQQQQQQLALPAPAQQAYSQLPPSQSELAPQPLMTPVTETSSTSLVPSAPGTSPASSLKSPTDQKPTQTPMVAGQPQMWLPMPGNYYPAPPSHAQNMANQTPTTQTVLATSQSATAPALPSLSYQGSVAATPYNVYAGKHVNAQASSTSPPTPNNPVGPATTIPSLYPQLPPPHSSQPSSTFQTQQPVAQPSNHSSSPTNFQSLNQQDQKQLSEAGLQQTTSSNNPQDYGKSAGANSAHVLSQHYPSH